jgi:hypothetical protein
VLKVKTGTTPVPAQLLPALQPVRTDDRQHHVVAYPGSGLRGEDVARRGPEEVDHRRVFPVGRVLHVDHDSGVRERFGQSLAGDMSTPVSGDAAASGSWPSARSFFMSFDPIRPVPPGCRPGPPQGVGVLTRSYGQFGRRFRG